MSKGQVSYTEYILAVVRARTVRIHRSPTRERARDSASGSPEQLWPPLAQDDDETAQRDEYGYDAHDHPRQDLRVQRTASRRWCTRRGACRGVRLKHQVGCEGVAGG